MTDEEKAKHIRHVIETKFAELSEYCDAVQILATWSGLEDPENTHSTFKGFGNWYSRIGMVTRFSEEEAAIVQTQMCDDSDDCPV